MKKVLTAVVVFAVAIAGYFGYSTYEQHKFVESIRPHVKNVSLRLTNASRYETEDGTKITFKELFEKLESDIAEIDKRILDVQTIATPANKDATDPVTDYMKGNQELLRALLTKYRKQLAVSTASDWVDRSLDELRSSNHYGFEYAKKATDKAIKELDKAIEESGKATADVVVTVTNLKDALARVTVVAPSDTLIDLTILDAIAKKNEPKPKSPSPDAKQ